MEVEIERKFLVKNNEWQKYVTRSYEIRQGYLNLEPNRNVRIRLKGEQGFITIKGATKQISRPEFEYEIPLPDARALLALCHQPVIEKTRYIIPIKNHRWEIDIFKAANQGLVIAEIELNNEHETFHLPEWLGIEVSQNPAYYNLALVTRPFTQWI